jgi:ABC-type branched-subunit amino acid transport system substrate-binding protein
VPDSVTLNDKERRQREVALNIYRGVKLAADQLEKEGMKADLFVYNVGDDKSFAASLMKKTDFKNSDVVIGPIFRDPLFEVANWAAKEDVHVVCPIAQSNKLLLTSSHISKTSPSPAAQWESLAEHIALNYKNANVLLINSGILEDTLNMQVFYDTYFKLAGDSARQVKAVSRSVASLSTMLSTKMQNVIICPSNDKAVIGSLFKSINQANTVVFGPEEWEVNDAISADFRNKYHVHFMKAAWIDYSNPEVQSWIEDFRKKYRSEPADYAFVAYDIMLFYGRGLMQFGKMFPDHFAEINQTGMVGTKFKFFRTGAESGFENKYINILSTDDFEIHKENP